MGLVAWQIALRQLALRQGNSLLTPQDKCMRGQLHMRTSARECPVYVFDFLDFQNVDVWLPVLVTEVTYSKNSFSISSSIGCNLGFVEQNKIRVHL